MSKKGDLQQKTKTAIEVIRNILDGLNGEKTTIRFLLYKLIGMKDENGQHATYIEDTTYYGKLQRLVNHARIRQDRGYPEWGLPDEPFIDNKREIRHIGGYADVNEFVSTVRTLYSRNIWKDQGIALFLLVEKATVGDVVESVTRRYQVPLAVSTGYFGRTFMLDIAKRIRQAQDDWKEVHIGYIGDHDPSGMDMEESLKEGNELDNSQCAQGLRQLMLGDYDQDHFNDCHWKRIAVTDEDFFDGLPESVKVPIKQLEKNEDGETTGDTRSPAYQQKYGDMGAEVEALDSQDLRDRVENWILARMDSDTYKNCMALEGKEREALASLHL